MMLRKSCLVISMCVVWLAINSLASMAMFMYTCSKVPMCSTSLQRRLRTGRIMRAGPVKR